MGRRRPLLPKEEYTTFSRLVQEKIGPGWNNRVKELLGKTKGCTHITEMLAQLATTAFQSMYSHRRQARNPSDRHKAGDSGYVFCACQR